MHTSITLEVIGAQQLVCEGCEQQIERLLKALPGVKQVRAQARKQRIEVLYDAALQEATAIADHLSAAGYQTRVGRSTSVV